MIIPIIVLAVVFVLIAVRQVGSVRLRIWQVMLGGALAVLLLQQISPMAALEAINPDVILFLFGMFVVGRAMEESGYLSYVAFHMFRRAKSVDALVLLILFGVGMASTVLMNDTLAIIGTPAVLLLARQHKVDSKMLLLALAFAVTIGSVMSPIGNPQNLLIALGGGLKDPFLTFLSHLLLPTIINLAVAYFLLRLFYREQFHDATLVHQEEPIHDIRLMRLCRVSLLVIIGLIIAHIALVATGSAFDLRLTYIALAGAAPILLFHRKRWLILRSIEWSTLVFFAAMFILMAAVWQSGFFQGLIASANIPITTVFMILVVSVLLSQLLSNVPLVALYLPLLVSAGAGTLGLVALAAGSTIAGNMLILGAASNIIIIQAAERKGETITFWEFARIGIPLTIINITIYWVCLTLL